MIVEFEEKDHIYSVNGDIASISVTELLKKHGLSPNYDGVNKQALRESAEKGKNVHKDLENVLNVANYEPKTEQGKQFAEWVKNNLDCGKGEQMLGFEEDGCITYVELDSSSMHNIKALEEIVDYAMSKDIPYFSINTPNDICMNCGHQG